MRLVFCCFKYKHVCCVFYLVVFCCLFVTNAVFLGFAAAADDANDGCLLFFGFPLIVVSLSLNNGRAMSFCFINFLISI